RALLLPRRSGGSESPGSCHCYHFPLVGICDWVAPAENARRSPVCGTSHPAADLAHARYPIRLPHYSRPVRADPFFWANGRSADKCLFSDTVLERKYLLVPPAERRARDQKTRVRNLFPFHPLGG